MPDKVWWIFQMLEKPRAEYQRTNRVVGQKIPILASNVEEAWEIFARHSTGNVMHVKRHWTIVGYLRPRPVDLYPWVTGERPLKNFEAFD